MQPWSLRIFQQYEDNALISPCFQIKFYCIKDNLIIQNSMTPTLLVPVLIKRLLYHGLSIQ